MTDNFQIKWKEYSHFFWKHIYDNIDTTYLFDYQSILFWGCVTHEEYIKSHLFKTNPIQTSNTKLNIYYYVRSIDTDLKFFAFVNTIGLKQMILEATSLEQDYIFLRRLYEKNFSIHNIFDHKYSQDCWHGLNQ